MDLTTSLRSLLTAGLLGLAACGKSSSDPQPAPATPTNPASVSEIKATVGSSTFAASGTNNVDGTRVTTSTAGESPSRLVLRGRAGTYDIALAIAQFTGAATYPVLPQGLTIASYSESSATGVSYNSQNMPGTAAVGQIVVTSWDAAAKRAQGTFTFSGRVRNTGGTYGATQQVTAGTFDVRDIGLF